MICLLFAARVQTAPPVWVYSHRETRDPDCERCGTESSEITESDNNEKQTGLQNLNESINRMQSFKVIIFNEIQRKMG